MPTIACRPHYPVSAKISPPAARSTTFPARVGRDASSTDVRGGGRVARGSGGGEGGGGAGGWWAGGASRGGGGVGGVRVGGVRGGGGWGGEGHLGVVTRGRGGGGGGGWGGASAQIIAREVRTCGLRPRPTGPGAGGSRRRREGHPIYAGQSRRTALRAEIAAAAGVPERTLRRSSIDSPDIAPCLPPKPAAGSGTSRAELAWRRYRCNHGGHRSRLQPFRPIRGALPPAVRRVAVGDTTRRSRARCVALRTLCTIGCPWPCCRLSAAMNPGKSPSPAS